MTYPSELGNDDDPVIPAPMPIDVRIVPADGEVAVTAAVFGSWMTFSWPAATLQSDPRFPLKLLPLDRNRRKAQIIVQIAAGFVVVGSLKQVANGQGGQLPSGRYPIENIEELYITSDNVNAATITVLQERD